MEKPSSLALGALGREFALAAGNLASEPRAMDRRQVEFVASMILDELEELLATTHGSFAGATLATLASTRPRRHIDVPGDAVHAAAAEMRAAVSVDDEAGTGKVAAPEEVMA